MSISLRDRLKLDISNYEKAKEAFLKTSTGKQLVKKVDNARNKQNNINFSICCRCIQTRQKRPPDEAVDRLQYFENKLTRATEKACKEELLRLKETAKEARSLGTTFQDDKHMKRANEILYKDKYRKNLLRAIESKNREQLETSISKVYGREPLTVTLRHELTRAEQCLAYVTRRERARKGSTWKFEYEPDQAGYNLSYWVGSDQYWLRDRYRKTERKREERIEEEEESSDHKHDKKPKNLVEPATTYKASSRFNEQDDANSSQDDPKKEDAIREDPIIIMEEENASDSKSDLSQLTLETESGNKFDDQPLLCIKKYTEELRQAIDGRNIDTIKTLLGEIYDENLQSEMPGIVSEAENLLRQMADERRQRNRVLVLRKELSRATDARNATKIRETLGKVYQEQVKDKLHNEVAKAENLLRILDHEEMIPDVNEEEDTTDSDVARLRQMLEAAKASANVSSLEMAIRSVLESGLRDFLQSELADANKTLGKLKEQEDFKKSVAEIPARYVSEVRSYVKPAPGVYQVMKATFLLLGFASANLQSWKDIQTHLGKTGTDSFRYRVIRSSTSDVKDDVISAVKGMLKSISLENAQNLSLLVNLFYRYCQAVVSEKSTTK